MRVARIASFLLVACAALLVVACQGAPLSSPTAPTGLSSPAALAVEIPADGFADVSAASEFTTLDRGRDGRGRPDHDDDDDDDDDDDNDHGDDDGEERHGNRRELSGFVTAKGADSLTVRGVTVKIGTDTVIRHGHRMLTLADINVGDHVQARGTRDGAILLATEIKVEEMDRDDDDDDEEDDDGAKVEGNVSELSGTCPTRSFKVGTTVVKTNSATRFDDLTCASLANGMRVEAKGSRQSDGSILAAKVELELD